MAIKNRYRHTERKGSCETKILLKAGTFATISDATQKVIENESEETNRTTNVLNINTQRYSRNYPRNQGNQNRNYQNNYGSNQNRLNRNY